jgi:Spy/CpxP family protein refolding chaperone
MNINARTLWTTLAALFVAAVALVTVSAQGQTGQERQGPGRGKGFRPGGPMLQRLNITDAQREQIRGIVEQQRQTDQAPIKKLDDLQRELHAVTFADSPDRAKIDQLKADIGQAEAAALDARVELDLKIAQVLTPEQRAQARELRPGGRGARGPRGQAR